MHGNQCASTSSFHLHIYSKGSLYNFYTDKCVGDKAVQNKKSYTANTYGEFIQ